MTGLAGQLLDDLAAIPDSPAGLLTPAMPDPARCRDAAQAFTPPQDWKWRGGEGRRFRVEISPGVVAVSVRDDARKERARTVTDAGRLNRAPHRCIRPGGSGRSVTQWSRKSRARMVRRFAELDYRPLYAQGTPAMLTLTYPASWTQLAPTGADAKRHLDLLRKRWAERWGRPMAGLWKLEFQRRGAPHFHLFMVPAGDPKTFRAWLSATWADIVAADVDSGERRRHLLAGTAVDYAQASRCTDPKRLAVYFLKHGTKTLDDKEYQHNVPALWQMQGAGPGRFWGYWQLERVRQVADVDLTDYLTARRLLRRWSRAPQPRHALVGGRRVWCHDGARRPGRVVTRGQLVGGWVAANDGAGLAVAIARALDVMRT